MLKTYTCGSCGHINNVWTGTEDTLYVGLCDYCEVQVMEAL